MMPRQDDPQTHPNFDAPIEIVADPSLSKQEKAETLEDLEQDARRLAIASGAGMRGGERPRRPPPCKSRRGRPLIGGSRRWPVYKSSQFVATAGPCRRGASRNRYGK